MMPNDPYLEFSENPQLRGRRQQWAGDILVFLWRTFWVAFFLGFVAMCNWAGMISSDSYPELYHNVCEDDAGNRIDGPYYICGPEAE